MSDNERCFIWFREEMTPYLNRMLGIKQHLISGESEFQKITIAETFSYGKCLIMDGKPQSAEVDEFVYHEALVHPAMISHPHPKRVFIIGGGEGATLREVLRYQSVQKVVMVEIDKQVVEWSKQYLPSFSQGAFDDPRVELLHLDGRRYLQDNQQEFDVIIIDICEPLEDSPAYLLFTEEFYQIVKRCLSSNGLIALQSGATEHSNLLCYTSVNKTLRSVFSQVAAYQTFISSYCLSWGFTVASDSLNPTALTSQEVDQRLLNRGIEDLRFYDGQCHLGLFSLPRHLRQALNSEGQIIKDNLPIYNYG